MPYMGTLKLAREQGRRGRLNWSYAMGRMITSVLGEIGDHGRLNAQEMALENDICSDLFQEGHNLQVCSSRSP